MVDAQTGDEAVFEATHERGPLADLGGRTLTEPRVRVLPGSLSEGFASEGDRLLIVSESEIFGSVTEVAVKEMKPNAANSITLKVPAGTKSKKMVVKLRKASADETSMMVITGLQLK